MNNLLSKIRVVRHFTLLVIFAGLMQSSSSFAQGASGDRDTLDKQLDAILNIKENGNRHMVEPTNIERKNTASKITRSVTRSIMFKREDLDRLYSVLEGAGYESLSIEEGGENGVEKVVKFITAPSFYLNSIMYYTPENWTIWINGNRIRKSDPEHGAITIASVNEDSVEVIWKSENLGIIYPNIISDFEQVNGKKYSGASLYWKYRSSDGGIFINKNMDMVRFRIGIQQSFVSHLMEVVEGKRADKEVAIENANSNIKIEYLPDSEGGEDDADFEGALDEIFTETEE